MKGQLVEEQNMQEVIVLFQLVQVHALPNRTSRLSTPDHSWTHVVGVT